MKNIVILGAGTGGTLVANLLNHQLNLSEWQLIIIDQAHTHLYQPGLSWLPFGLYGYEDGHSLVKPITDPLPRNAQFINAAITFIDHHNQIVTTSHGNYTYDILVCALGCHLEPTEVEGLAAALGHQVYTFYTLDQAEKLRSALDRMRHGHLVLNICDMPIKCPIAPIEFMFLADYYFNLREIRHLIDLTFVTPLSGAFTKPNADRILTTIAQRKGIKIVPNFNISAVDTATNSIRSFEGQTIEYDLLVTIPPNRGPKVLEISGLGDANGYAITDPRTLRSKLAEHIYFIGDNANVNTSKASSVAHFEAETIVNNILREINGKAPMPTFDGHANCFIESGYHKALLVDFNYDMEPLSGDFPLPYAGPFSLLKESYLNHVGKITFKWVYWNMLLPGHLGYVPMLPSHMSILGKDVTSLSQIRSAQLLRIKDVMTTAVITISQGASLTEATDLMLDKHISGLPVLNADGHLIGIITAGDLISALNNGNGMHGPLRLIARKCRNPKRMGTIVDDLMTRNPITIKTTDTLQVAIALMDNNNIKRLIVTDDTNRVIGIVSRTDLIKLFVLK